MRLSCLLPFLFTPLLFGQSHIEYSAAKKVWLLHTESSAYAVGVNPRGELQNLYWGGPLWRLDDVRRPAGASYRASIRPNR